MLPVTSRAKDREHIGHAPHSSHLWEVIPRLQGDHACVLS